MVELEHISSGNMAVTEALRIPSAPPNALTPLEAFAALPARPLGRELAHPGQKGRIKAYFENWRRMLTYSLLGLGLIICSINQAAGQERVHQDSQHKFVTLSDGTGQLALRLNYDGRCILDQVIVRGRQVAADTGISTGVRADARWFNTGKIATPGISVGRDTLTVTGIKFGHPGNEIRERWRFTVKPDQVLWRITRWYPTNAAFDDVAFPDWDFRSMSTWTGGMLDNGGVIWNKYLDKTDATYGAHFGTVTFWNSQSNDCLRITPNLPRGQFGAGRFSRQGNGVFSFNYSICDEELKPKHELSRFLGNRQDLWSPFRAKPSEVSVEFTLKAMDYGTSYDRGALAGLDGSRVRDLLNTVARYGVIDQQLTGGNGWRSGFICLHEQFFAEIGLALDQDDYTANFSKCLDYERDHAIGVDGRVKSRWDYGPGDAMPGSFDSFGFYEAKWGWLLDSQPGYVINVAEQFNLTGDHQWLARQKACCEKALNFLLRREVANSGLVAMMNDSLKQQKSSDWIDIIWASYENSLVNAELYCALQLWADGEDTLNDPAKAANYRAFAARLKASFNQPIASGGFWDPTNQWYVYWREKDGAVHGNNLVTPVNFAAIAYGLCDDDSRKKAILDRIEQETQKEGLFTWPLNFFPYQRDEGAGRNFPFPQYENGDLFLSWNELGVRAYAAYDPALALKYVRNTLDRYGEDGLSFQRYLRQSQRGAGDDILAGNCMAIVGLYRDIYGIQPKPNRLYVEPHLTTALNGTKLHYQSRGQLYLVDLDTKGCAITADGCTIRDSRPFGINATVSGLEYFPGTNADWALCILESSGRPLAVQIESWPINSDAPRQWTETTPQAKGKTTHRVAHLQPGANYDLKIDGQISDSFRADKIGRIKFNYTHGSGAPRKFELVPSTY